MRAYTINQMAEETGCDYCGWPLYIGDRAYIDGGDVYCCKDCGRTHKKIRQREERIRQANREKNFDTM